MTSAFTDAKQLKESRRNIIFFKRCPKIISLLEIIYHIIHQLRSKNNAIFCLISTILGIQYGREKLKKGSVDDRKLAETRQRDYEVFADARASHCDSGACIFVTEQGRNIKEDNMRCQEKKRTIKGFSVICVIVNPRHPPGTSECPCCQYVARL
jgi:hypothetical protein